MAGDVDIKGKRKTKAKARGPAQPRKMQKCSRERAPNKTNRKNVQKAKTCAENISKEMRAVKVSFGGRLAPRSPPPLREFLQHQIDQRVLLVSQRRKHASLVLNWAIRKASQIRPLV